MAKEKIASSVSALLDDYLEGEGYSLYHCEFTKEGRDRYLKVYIDKNEGYVGTEDCEKVSRFLSDKLDETDLISQNYYLVVSSPGLDRPLKSVADLLRNKGRTIRVTRSTGKPLTGKLLDADEDNLTLALKGNAGNVVVPRSEVLVAKVDVQI